MAPDREQRASAPDHATGAVEFVALADIAGDEVFRLRPDGDVSELATNLGRLGQLSPVELRPWPAAASDGPRWQVVSGFRRLAAVRLLARESILARLHGRLSDEDAWGLALGEALLREPLTGDELEALRVRLRAGGVASWADELIDEALVRAPLPASQREAFFDFLRGVPAPPAEGAAGVEAAAPPGTAPPQPAGPDAAPPSVAATTAPPPALEAAAEEAVEPSPEPAGSGLVPLGDVVPLADVGAAAEPEIVEVTPEELVEDLTARLYAINQDLATAFEAWEDLPQDGRRALVEQARYVVALLPYMEGTE